MESNRDILGSMYDIDTSLPGQYQRENRIQTILNQDREIDNYEVSEYMKNKYKGKPIRMIKDIELFTKLCNQLPMNKRAIKDSRELETYRVLEEGTLSRRGVFYSEGVQMTTVFPLLKHTTFVSTINDAFNGRYMLPIKFPDGDVFTFIGYDPKNPKEKYSVQKISTDRNANWVKQGNLLGNLESLEMYGKVDDVFVVEGMFDAYQINNHFKKPSISLLGSKLYRNKNTLLNYIKNKYKCRFIYVPDFDASGLDPYLIRSPLWDDIYNYNEGRKKNEVYKDVDAFLREKAENLPLYWGLDKYLK